MGYHLCEYGCGLEAKHKFKNGKWCCSKSKNSCVSNREYLRIKFSGSGNPMFGKKHREESIRKNREANLGEKNGFYNKKHSKETKKIMSEKKIGKTWIELYGEEKTERLRKEQSERNLGKGNPMYGKQNPKPKEAAKRQALKIIGSHNPNWKGGISYEPYCEQWLDKDYKESIKERDGYKCLNPECNKTSKQLCIHHIDYIKKNCHPLNLITVCISCNSKANTNRRWHKAWYQSIIYRRYKI